MNSPRQSTHRKRRQLENLASLVAVAVATSAPTIMARPQSYTDNSAALSGATTPYDDAASVASTPDLGAYGPEGLQDGVYVSGGQPVIVGPGPAGGAAASGAAVAGAGGIMPAGANIAGGAGIASGGVGATAAAGAGAPTVSVSGSIPGVDLNGYANAAASAASAAANAYGAEVQVDYDITTITTKEVPDEVLAKQGGDVTVNNDNDVYNNVTNNFGDEGDTNVVIVDGNGNPVATMPASTAPTTIPTGSDANNAFGGNAPPNAYRPIGNGDDGSQYVPQDPSQTPSYAPPGDDPTLPTNAGTKGPNSYSDQPTSSTVPMPSSTVKPVTTAMPTSTASAPPSESGTASAATPTVTKTVSGPPCPSCTPKPGKHDGDDSDDDEWYDEEEEETLRRIFNITVSSNVNSSNSSLTTITGALNNTQALPGHLSNRTREQIMNLTPEEEEQLKKYLTEATAKPNATNVTVNTAYGPQNITTAAEVELPKNDTVAADGSTPTYGYGTAPPPPAETTRVPVSKDDLLKRIMDIINRERGVANGGVNSKHNCTNSTATVAPDATYSTPKNATSSNTTPCNKEKKKLVLDKNGNVVSGGEGLSNSTINALRDRVRQNATITPSATVASENTAAPTEDAYSHGKQYVKPTYDRQPKDVRPTGQSLDRKQANGTQFAGDSAGMASSSSAGPSNSVFLGALTVMLTLLLN